MLFTLSSLMATSSVVEMLVPENIASQCLQILCTSTQPQYTKLTRLNELLDDNPSFPADMITIADKNEGSGHIKGVQQCLAR